MNVTSVLDAVTVYALGAVCTRLAKLPATGSAQVRVTGLPLSLQAGSLRARLATSQARVLDVRPGWDVELAQEADVPAEQKAFEAASLEVSRLSVEHARVEREIGELQKLKPAFPATRPSEPPRTAPVEALLKAAEFVSTELSSRFATRRTLVEQLEDAQAEVELRRRRLAEASTALRTQRARLSRVALVTLSAPAPDAELELEYFVPGARWVPSYALRLQKGMAAGVLSMRASVAQATGEDWSQVKLSLSTAALDRRTALPELKSLRIGREQAPPARSGWREPPPGLDELFGGFDQAWSRRPAPPPKSAPAAPPAVPASVVTFAAHASTAEATAVGKKSAPPRQSAPAGAAAVRAPSAKSEMAREEAMPTNAPARLQQQAAPMMMRKSRSVFGGFGGGGGAPRDADEAEEDLALDGMATDELLSADDAPAEAPAEPSVELGSALLDYGSLFIAAPSAGRGRLTRIENSLTQLTALRVEISLFMAAVSMSESVALRVQQLPLPPRTTAPLGGSFDYRYACAARVDVPSRGEWSMVPVADADVGLIAEYVCVPSVEPQVYRTLRLHNRSKHALLPGPVDVTLGDEFLLTADLPLIAPGAQDARLGLGVEEAVKVARKTHFKETTGGLLGGSTVLPHDLEIEIANRLPAPALIEVRERVPFSTEDDVKIEEATVKPPWEKDEAEREGAVVRGGRVWRVTVPANEKTTLTAQFVVRIPSDKMLVGGNRRA